MQVDKPVYRNVHQDLVDRCKRSDGEAQQQLYMLYYRNMFNAAKRIVNDAHTAEDVMQEAFLKAFTRITTYNNTSSFGTWLKRIVINESINELRKNRMEYTFDDSREVEMPETPTQETPALSVEQIKQAMEGINDRYRTVLSLILLEGYDHEEVAGILGISYNNSRVIYMRAKDKLKKILHYEK